MKYCQDCKWLKKDRWWTAAWITDLFLPIIGWAFLINDFKKPILYGKCTHKSAAYFDTNTDHYLVKNISKGKDNYFYASTERGRVGGCGSEAKHFEVKKNKGVLK